MTQQLQMNIGPRENPNAHLFNADGSMKRLLWCSDTARLGGACPYVGEKARFRPSGGCCKNIEREVKGGDRGAA